MVKVKVGVAVRVNEEIVRSLDLLTNLSVRPSVHPSVCLSVRPSVCLRQEIATQERMINLTLLYLIPTMARMLI